MRCNGRNENMGGLLGVMVEEIYCTKSVFLTHFCKILYAKMGKGGPGKMEECKCWERKNQEWREEIVRSYEIDYLYCCKIYMLLIKLFFK